MTHLPYIYGAYGVALGCLSFLLARSLWAYRRTRTQWKQLSEILEKSSGER